MTLWINLWRVTWPARRKRNLKICRYLGLERTLFYPEIPLHTAWSSRKTLLRWHMIWRKRLHLLEQKCKLWINLCQDCFLVARLPHDRTVDMAGLNLRISSRLKGRYITSQVPFAVPTDSFQQNQEWACKVNTKHKSRNLSFSRIPTFEMLEVHVRKRSEVRTAWGIHQVNLYLV